MSQELSEMKTAGTQLSVFSQDGFELVQRMAKAFSSSSMVPKHYQGPTGIGNCIIALNMAQRIGSDPLMTMQNLYIVHGNPAWSSQFLISTFNACGRFSSIRYEFQGEEGKDSWGCRAIATEKASGEVLRGAPVTIALAKAEGWYSKAGSKWKTMPEQMLRYRAAAWFVRAYAPEIAMGLHCVEEIEDSHANTSTGNGRASTITLDQLATPATEPNEIPEGFGADDWELQTTAGQEGE